MYITYGSRTSNPDPQALPPHQRYFSDRVWYVRQLAKDAGEEFAIITAEYGLVFEENYIPLHDHMLNMNEVETLGKEVAKQLKQKGASAVTFFIISEEWSEGGAAYKYNLVLQLACHIASVSYAVKPITVELGERTKGKPTPVRPENVEIGGPHTMNKKAEYELIAQDEKGLWKSIRKSSFLPDLQIKARSLSKKFPDRKVSIILEKDTTEFPF